MGLAQRMKMDVFGRLNTALYLHGLEHQYAARHGPTTHSGGGVHGAAQGLLGRWLSNCVAELCHQSLPTTDGLLQGALVLAMIGVSYASVPLYRMFCQATGVGGTVRQGHRVEEKLRQRQEHPDAALEAKAAARELRVWMTADVADDMPWRFTPAQEFVRVKPGQSTLVFYRAENLSDKPITGVSTYNVVPDKAGYYFNKIQCFCFEEQRLQPHEVVDMPVFFYIDPEMVMDHNARNVHDITLSYTFFKVEDEEEEEEAQDPAPVLPGSGIKLHGPSGTMTLQQAQATAAGLGR